MSNNIKDYFKETPNFLSFFVFSFFISSLSPILIEISKTFIINPENLNLIFASFTVGNIVGRLTSFFFRTRFKNLHIMISAYTLLSVLVIVLSQLKIILLFFIIYFISGYLLGIILVISTENLLEGSVVNKERLITISTSFAPLGSIVSPLITSYLVKNGYNWKYLYYVLLFMIVLVVTLYLIIHKHRQYTSTVAEQKLIFKGIFLNKKNNIIFTIILFCILFYVMPEFIIANWSPTFFRMEGIIDVQGAGYMLSIFWTLLIIGRIIVSFLASRLKSVQIMLILTSVSLISTIFLVNSKISLAIYLFIILAGLGYSGLYPLLFSNGSTIYRKGRGTLATLLLLFSGIGQSFASYLNKVISKYNMFLSVFMAVIFVVILLILFIILMFYKKTNFGLDK